MQSAAAFESVRAEPQGLPHEIALSDVQNATVQKGLAIWHQARAGRPFPARTDLSPRVLSDVLRNTVLLRLLPSASDYEFRIVGDAMVQAIGKSFQGMNTAEVDLILPGVGTLLHRLYDYVRMRGEPLAMRGWYQGKGGSRSLFHETVVLPLGSDGTVDHLIVFAAYAFNPDEKTR